jgi:hypothetical protein
MIRYYVLVRPIDFLSIARETAARRWCRMFHKKVINWSVFDRLYYTCGDCGRRWEVQ